MTKRVTRSFPASFVRGGTSNGLIIDRAHLPDSMDEWQPILASTMGSPDASGRQLNGLGQGISSTSKICVLSPSQRDDADVDYTFVQVGIKGGDLDVAGNCGNMSSAVGPMAWDMGLAKRDRVVQSDGEVTLRLFNWNTNKILHSTFAIDRSRDYDPTGDYTLDGVAGSGSKIILSFVDPAGSKTGKALPTGNAIDELELADGSCIKASLVDVANPGVFVLASDLGVPGDISPDVLGSDSQLMSRLQGIRDEGARRMGLDPNIQSIPKIVLVSEPSESEAAQGINIVCRALSMQQAHKAVPLTLALNLGAACGITGTIPARTAVDLAACDRITIAHASGQVDVGSIVKNGKIEGAQLHRTARLLMRGDVYYTVDDP